MVPQHRDLAGTQGASLGVEAPDPWVNAWLCGSWCGRGVGGRKWRLAFQSLSENSRGQWAKPPGKPLTLSSLKEGRLLHLNHPGRASVPGTASDLTRPSQQAAAGLPGSGAKLLLGSDRAQQPRTRAGTPPPRTWRGGEPGHFPWEWASGSPLLITTFSG